MAIFVLVILFFFYSLTIIKVILSWKGVLKKEIKSNTKLYVSIIIPVRNEFDNINYCIESILDQSYQNFEVIVVDDHSVDYSMDRVKYFNDPRIHLLNCPKNQHGKKAALMYGIDHAQYTWIVTIDADTVFQPLWLENMMKYSNQYDCLVGPVKLQADSKLLSQFQMWDFMALQGFTKAGIDRRKYFMANGANLAFKKAWFSKVGGYEGNTHIASGDDYFLLEKFRRMDSSKIMYVPSRESIGLSKPMVNVKDFYAQRMRWGGKMKHLGINYMGLLLIFIWIINVLWCTLVLRAIFITPFSNIELALIIIKMAVDYLLLSSVGSFFKERLSPLSYPFLSFFHAFYMALAGLMSVVSLPIKWKNRAV